MILTTEINQTGSPDFQTIHDNDPGFESSRGQEIFLFSETPRPALEAHPASYSTSTGFFPGDEGVEE
jgi:hypothetical protein